MTEKEKMYKNFYTMMTEGKYYYEVDKKSPFVENGKRIGRLFIDKLQRLICKK